jgi:methylated-DNA-[protein]-cysteine S-methyltransferase
MTLETRVAPSPLTGCCTTGIYCLPDCVPGRRTLPKNRVAFASQEEAKATGYRACKVCKPDGPNPEPETFSVATHGGPLGTYLLVSSERGLVLVEPLDEAEERGRLCRWGRQGIRQAEGWSEHTRAAAQQLDEFFRGRRREFTVPLDARGTAFDRQVWEALRGIPYGETRSYGQMARTIGRPTASRAVGHANGRNPISIIVPCHRVVGAGGALVGYGGGLDRKDALLALERGATDGQARLPLR